MNLATLMLGASLALAQATEDSFAQGQAYAQSEPLQFEPALVGFATGVCLGWTGCLGATAYYYIADPPTPLYAEQDRLWLLAYEREMKRRRARWAFLGGTAGTLATGAAVTGFLIVYQGGLPIW